MALETRADPLTERIVLESDEVALPGLTDAHLHLARAAEARRQVDLSAATTLAEGLALIRAAHLAADDPDAWLEGHGWDVDRWGRWPTAADLETVGARPSLRAVGARPPRAGRQPRGLRCRAASTAPLPIPRAA